MPKRELRRFHVQAPLTARKRRGRKLVIRLVSNTKASNLEKSGELAVGRTQDSRLPTSCALVPTQKLQRRALAWRWSLLWVSVFSILGVTVVSGVLWLTKLPPPVNCQRISPSSTDSDRLFCAQRAAMSGKQEQLVVAVKLVQDLRPDNPLYREAQRMLKESSGAILEIAQQKIKQADKLGAVMLANKIPVSSPLYPEAQAAIATWQQQWTQGEETVRQFKEALKVQNWSKASGLITALQQHPQEYWRLTRVDALIRQLEEERQAWQQLQEARDLAKTNKLDQLKEAIALTTKISPNSYVQAQALLEQSRWCSTLLKLAAINFEKQDFVAMVSVLDGIPVNTSQYSEVQDWIRLARASKTAKENNILAFVDALAAIRQIDSKSPIHSLASRKADQWQSQFQDQVKLQFAGAIASFDQQMGLAYAIDQARRIAPGRPQRPAAQTLIAQWRKEIQQIEDRKKLMDAQQLADRGTIEQLKAAVELASKIQLGQPLRLEAQSAIAKWNRQIQIFEDQPILELASTYAQRRDLMAAISTARQIRPERALYSEAQQVIQGWVAQIQTAEDRPILEAATALAAQGRFDAAIMTVSQITPERPLYGQAQAMKSTWESQKAAMNGEAQSATPESN